MLLTAQSEWWYRVQSKVMALTLGQNNEGDEKQLIRKAWHRRMNALSIFQIKSSK